MAYPDPSTVINATGGGDKIFLYIASIVPSFFPIVLLALFVIIWIGGNMSHKRREGVGDVPLWFLLAAFICTVAAVGLSLTVGLLNPRVFAILFSTVFIGVVWTGMTRNS